MSAGTDLAIIAGQHGDRPVLRLRGELDVSSRDRLRGAIGAVLERHPPVLVVDASGLEFTDCGGLSVLVWAHRRLAERGHQLVITGATPMVRRLLHLTGMDSYLHLGGPDLELGNPDLELGNPYPELGNPYPELGNPDPDRSTPESITPEQGGSAPLGTTVIPGPAADAAGSAHADLEPR